MSMCDYCKHKGQCKQPQWIQIAVQKDDMYCEAFKGDGLPPISMGNVTAPFVAMHKSVTRRNWAQVTVNRFKKDIYSLAWSKQARFGGEPIGVGRITKDPFKEYTGMMTYDQYIKEGFRYLDVKTGNSNLKQVFERWQRKNEILSVIQFQIIEVFPGMKKKYTTDKEIVRCVKALAKAIG